MGSDGPAGLPQPLPGPLLLETSPRQALTAGCRRAEHQIVSVRSRALAAATEILTTRGLEQMSLKAIARHAGIGIATIYHYFKSKDDLLLSLALLGFEDLRRDIVRCRALPEYRSPMRGGTQAFLSFARTRPELLSMMFSERLMARHEALRSAEQAAFQAYCSAVEDDDRLPKEHRASAALALWALGRGISGMASSQPDHKIPPDVLDRLLAGARYLINHPA